MTTSLHDSLSTELNHVRTFVSNVSSNLSGLSCSVCASVLCQGFFLGGGEGGLVSNVPRNVFWSVVFPLC